MSPVQEDIVVKDYPDWSTRQEPWQDTYCSCWNLAVQSTLQVARAPACLMMNVLPVQPVSRQKGLSLSLCLSESVLLCWR